MGYTGHLGIAFNSKELIERFQAVIPSRFRHVGLVGTGMSGGVSVPVLAAKFDLPFAIVRERDKPGRSRVEGTLQLHDPWIFVDDCICSGTTLGKVLHEMGAEGYTQHVGSFTFGHERFDTPRFKEAGVAEEDLLRMASRPPFVRIPSFLQEI